MRMPQDFVDAINAAVREINPNAGHMVSGSMTLGFDFDEWLGHEAILKYGLREVPDEVVAAFEAKFNEKREQIKASLVASAVDIEKRRMAGTLVNQPPVSGRPKQDIRDFLESLNDKEKAQEEATETSVDGRQSPERTEISAEDCSKQETSED